MNSTCNNSTAQTNLGLRPRTFSLKINKLPIFSEITQAWQCLKIVFIRQISSHTEFQLQIMFLTLDIDPTTPNIKIYTTHHKITQP